jgi:hypothetical protein
MFRRIARRRASSRSLAALFTASWLAACGASRGAGGVDDNVGASCGDTRPVAVGAVEVEFAAECDGGACLHSAAVAAGAVTSAGMCTCRCDGPPNTGPFCSCDAGFACVEQLRELGLPSSRNLAGSYCVPAE